MAVSESKFPTQKVPRTAWTSPRLIRAKANGLALFAALAWGLGNVSQKTILDDLDPYTANGLTCLIGFVVLLPFSRREGRDHSQNLKGDAGLLARVAIAFTLAATLMQVGYGHTTVTNAGFLVNTSAVLTPIISWIWYRRRPVFWVWPSSLCTVFGVFLMGGGGAVALSYGDALSLLAALVFAIWTLLVGAYVLRHGRPILLTVVQLAVCGAACVAWGLAQNGIPSVAMLNGALPEILLIGICSKGLAYVLMAMAQQHISPSSAAVLVSAESVFGALLAMIFLAEAPGPIRLVGSVFIILGVGLAMRIPTVSFENEAKT